MISDFDRRTPTTPGPRPDRDATEKAVRFGLLCIGDIDRALRATYEHHAPDDRAQFLAWDLHGAVALARIAGHYGRLALEQHAQDQRRTEGQSLLRSIKRQRLERSA